MNQHARRRVYAFLDGSEYSPSLPLDFSWFFIINKLQQGPEAEVVAVAGGEVVAQAAVR
jgi:hypothetical protein